MDKVRLGIIGVGNMGSGHIENIVAGKCPEIEVTAIADRKEDRRQWAIEKLPDVAVFTEGEDLIRERRVRRDTDRRTALSASGSGDAGL